MYAILTILAALNFELLGKFLTFSSEKFPKMKIQNLKNG